MTERAVKVTAFTLRERVQAKGNVQLGFFDCELPGVRLQGCILVLLRSGNVVALGPRPDTFAHIVRRVTVTDPAWHADMRDQATAAYLQMRGTTPPATSNEAMEIIGRWRDEGVFGETAKACAEKDAAAAPRPSVQQIQVTTRLLTEPEKMKASTEGDGLLRTIARGEEPKPSRQPGPLDLWRPSGSKGQP